MSESERKKKRNEWGEGIAPWQKRGLNAKEWCKLNEVSRSTFCCWQQQFGQAAGPENTKEKVEVGVFIEIQCNDVTVKVDKTFDGETLGQVLGVLRKLS
jgi:hypothetical protein